MTQDKASYDSQSKNLLSHKIFLARILSHVLSEFINRSDEYIIKCIESNPLVGSLSVNTGELIEGRENQISFISEGSNTFDICFDIYIPQDREAEKRIIDVEIQNNYYPGYPLENRAEFYAGRMMSMQYGREFERMEYDKLRKVYSIWINTNPPKHLRNTIYEKKMIPELIHGEGRMTKERQLMNIVMMNLGEPEECTGILRMLAVILSNKIKAYEKKEILEKEYGIKIDERIEEEMKDMCDLADAIEREGIDKGRKEGIEQGKQQGLEEGKISLMITLLTKKIGKLTNETMMSIKTASQESIERLVQNFMSIENEEDIQVILIH